MSQDKQQSTRRRFLKVGAISGTAFTGIPGLAKAQSNGNGNGRGGGDIEIEWAKNSNGIAGNGEIVAANAAIEFFPTRKLIPAYSFDIERLSTGDVISVSVELDGKPPDARAIVFDFYDWEGRLARNSPRPPAELDVWTGSEWVNVGLSVSGDLDIFRGGQSYDEYEITLFRGGGRADTTSTHIVPIAHPKKFDSQFINNNQTFQFSFNANGLPSNANLHAVIDRGQNSTNVPKLYHDSGRYYGEVSASELSSGDHDVAMTVTDSTTGFRIISLQGWFTT